MKQFLNTLYRYWMIFAKKLAIIPTTIILSLIYVIAVGPIAIANFIMRKDILNKRFADKDSFWLDKEHVATDPERCKRQF